MYRLKKKRYMEASYIKYDTGDGKEKALLFLMVKQVTPFKISTGLFFLINPLFASILLYS